jgi:hypothetical protein
MPLVVIGSYRPCRKCLTGVFERLMCENCLWYGSLASVHLSAVLVETVTSYSSTLKIALITDERTSAITNCVYLQTTAM